MDHPSLLDKCFSCIESGKPLPSLLKNMNLQDSLEFDHYCAEIMDDNYNKIRDLRNTQERVSENQDKRYSIFAIQRMLIQIRNEVMEGKQVHKPNYNCLGKSFDECLNVFQNRSSEEIIEKPKPAPKKLDMSKFKMFQSA